ncbi:MobF family relaxase [Fuerstiella marisgermanici]|uniref:Multifunctional conjugation protein TraI n=1 Tax=Fuerstiella marisgermanici TaxID=1891926 RepID=A0A1P8WH70_9PLAN|nr:MobF family relaxase [Fuerstiella marisgermanici]APZ93414.1 Multifunctional conjugation protein TraI [Fuerstiella marisgermanici]
MRVTHSRSSRGAKNYYNFSDYYDTGPSQLKGQWFGNGARMLGLAGDVQKEHFDRLVDNLMPFEDTRLTQRNHANRRVGTDITLSASKSVSLLWAYTQDDEILQAVQKAAHATLGDLEQDAQTRVNHARGRMTLNKTRNIVGASWLHTTSRPVDGYPDPSLHVHGFVINATNTGDRWTAVDLSTVVRDSGYYEAIFQSRLAENMEALGYRTERSNRDFEIAGISRETIEKFSRRTAQIEKLAAEQGITNADTKGLLGAQTRDLKTTNTVAVEDLPSVWRGRLTEVEQNQFDRIARRDYDDAAIRLSASEAVDFATDHSFERESVVRERQLLRNAILQGIGRTTVDNIQAEVASRDWIREGDEETAEISTREVLAEEQSLLDFARKGRGAVLPLAATHTIERDWLSEEQKNAVQGLLSSTDRVQILRGVAGAGKTTLMKEAIEAMEGSGLHVAVLAPTAEAAHGVLREEEGFDGNTLASFLVDERAQKRANGGVVWVDEGALVGTSDLAKLAAVAERIDARVVLSGDGRQHQPVARGLPFHLLETQAGIKPLEVKKIRRQENPEYRDAVSALSRGDVKQGIDKLDDLGFIHEIKDAQTRNESLASDYADSIAAGKTSLVVAPTHAEREVVTSAIRSELKNRGLVSKDERTITTLKSRRLTAAQRSDAFNYEPGDVVEFVTKGKGGFNAGDRLTVTQIHDGKVFAGPHGETEVPVGSPKSFDVYRKQEQGFAVGDLIRITKNRRPDKDSSAKRLTNGSLVKLKGFTKNGYLKLSNGRTIPPEWGHIDHGVAVTSYGSQGKTFQRVFVAQSSLSFPASSPEQAYVSASRGKEQLTIYTDDKSALKSAVAHVRPAKNASDLRPNQLPSTEAPRSRLLHELSQIRLRAARFASDQIRRFSQWAGQRQLQPQQAR